MKSDMHESKHMPEIKIHFVNAIKTVFCCILLSTEYFYILLHTILKAGIILFKFIFVVKKTMSQRH